MSTQLKIQDRIKNIMRSFNSAFPDVEYYIGSDYESINLSTNYIVFSFSSGTFGPSTQSRQDNTFVSEDGYKHSYSFCGNRQETIIADLWFDTYDNMETVLSGLLGAIKICETVHASNINWDYVSESDGSVSREGQHVTLNFTLTIPIPDMTFFLHTVTNIQTTYVMDVQEIPEEKIVNEELNAPDKYAINELSSISSPNDFIENPET